MILLFYTLLFCKYCTIVIIETSEKIDALSFSEKKKNLY